MTKTGIKTSEKAKEKKLKYSSFSIPIVPVLLGIILALSISVGVLLNKTCPQQEISNVPSVLKCPDINKKDLNLLYLMPLNCTTCDLRMIQNIETDLNVSISSYVTDKVLSPMIFIGTKNIATLALANSRYNVLAAICEFAEDKTACSLKKLASADYGPIAACLDKYDIDSRSIIFLYSNTCVHCTRMKPWIKKLENQSYNFTWIETQDSKAMKIVKDCLTNILETHGYVPQFACPYTKELHVGEFASISQLRDFADRCKNATLN